MKLKVSIGLFILFLSLSTVFAASEDEDALFGDTQTVVELSNVQNAAMASNDNPRSVGLSGTIQATGLYGMSRDWLTGKTGTEDNSFQTAIQGNFLLDVRIADGIKSFANLAAYYMPSGQISSQKYFSIVTNTNTYKIETNAQTLYTTNYTILSLKEFFVDANIEKAVYFRFGKQVLQWGRGYLWNPSDLINIEQKNFFDMSAYREGSYGAKVHIPFGTVVNLYGYANMTGIEEIDDTALAGKAEVLLGSVEMSLSAWAKKDYHPVYAFDFNAFLFGIQFYGEASLSDNPYNKISNVSSTWTNILTGDIYDYKPAFYTTTNEWAVKATLGFRKYFTIFDEKKDQIMLIGEFLYNSAGYTDNPFEKDLTRYAWIYSGDYVAYQNSRFYAAFFLSCSQFFLSDLTMSLNGMMNLNDYSGVISTGLSYAPGFDFTLGLTVNTYFGNTNCEFTLADQPLSVQFTSTLSF